MDFRLTAEILLIKQFLVINHCRNCSSTEESSIQRSLRLLDVIRLRKFHKYFHMDLCIVLLTLSFLIDYHIFDLEMNMVLLLKHGNFYDQHTLPYLLHSSSISS